MRVSRPGSAPGPIFSSAGIRARLRQLRGGAASIFSVTARSAIGRPRARRRTGGRPGRRASITMPSKMSASSSESTWSTTPTCAPSEARTGVPWRSSDVGDGRAVVVGHRAQDYQIPAPEKIGCDDRHRRSRHRGRRAAGRRGPRHRASRAWRRSCASASPRSAAAATSARGRATSSAASCSSASASTACSTPARRSSSSRRWRPTSSTTTSSRPPGSSPASATSRA